MWVQVEEYMKMKHFSDRIVQLKFQQQYQQSCIPKKTIQELNFDRMMTICNEDRTNDKDFRWIIV